MNAWDRLELLDWSTARAFTRRELTTYPEKADLYSREPLFREALYEVAGHGGCTSEDELGRLIRSVGLAVVRPDAIWAAKTDLIMDFLDRLRLHPRLARRLEIGSAQVREVWRYQLNAASLMRLRLMDLLFAQGDSVLVLFDDPGTFWPVPCSCVLSDAKGEAEPAERDGWELRSVLDSPHRLLSFIHTADEPADVVRDGAILLSAAGLAASMCAVHMTPDDVSSELGAAALRPSLRSEHDLERVLELLGSHGAPDAWRILQDEPLRSSMTAGTNTENLLGRSPTDEWWGRVGALAHREHLLRAAAENTIPMTTTDALALICSNPTLHGIAPGVSAPVIPVSRPTLAGGEAAALAQVLDSGWWTAGAFVRTLEERLVDVTGAPYAVAVSSGTAAIHAVLAALGCDSSTLVVTSSLNSVAVPACAMQLGARVALTDVEPDRLTMAPESLETVLREAAPAASRVIVVPVHYAGAAADMARISAVAARHGAIVFEDASHVMGTTYRGSASVVGAWPTSAAATFSFHSNKPVAAGEGGAIVTASEELAAYVRRFRDHSMVRGSDVTAYVIDAPALNLRMSEFSAAVACAQLETNDERRAERARLAATYDAALATTPWCRTLGYDVAASSHHLYPVILDLEHLGVPRHDVVKHCAGRGVSLQVHYAPLHRQILLRDLPLIRTARFTKLDEVADRLVSLPLYAGLTDAEQRRVVDALSSVSPRAVVDGVDDVVARLGGSSLAPMEP